MLSKPDPAIMRLKYRKLLSNLGNAFQAITGNNAWNSGSEARDFMASVRQEGLDCFQAAGVACASEEEYTEQVQRLFHTEPVGGQKRSGSSTWQSLIRGHTTVETDYLNGEIVLLGRLHGIQTPYNSVLRRESTRVAGEAKGPGTLSLADLQAKVEAEPACMDAMASKKRFSEDL
ncbi:MAG: ketopantoate reductase family protein [Dehalococcoidia bacterium]